MTRVYITCPYCLLFIPIEWTLTSSDDVAIQCTRSAFQNGRVVVTYRPKYVVVHHCPRNSDDAKTS